MSSTSFKDDFVSSLANWRFWVTFGWLDVVNANIRTRAGIVLFPLLAGVWIVSIGYMFGDLLGEGRPDFMAYVGIGYVVFTFMSGCITASYSVFSRNIKIIQNVPIGTLNFPLRETTRFFFQMLLQCITVAIVLWVTGIEVGANAVLVLPALVVLVVFGFALTLFFGVVGTYLPDFAALVGSFMRLMFFVTPIWWYADNMGGTRGLIADINPFTHFLRLFRYPLLQNSLPPTLTLVMVTASTVVVFVAAMVVFAYTRRNIVLRL